MQVFARKSLSLLKLGRRAARNCSRLALPIGPGCAPWRVEPARGRLAGTRRVCLCPIPAQTGSYGEPRRSFLPPLQGVLRMLERRCDGGIRNERILAERGEFLKMNLQLAAYLNDCRARIYCAKAWLLRRIVRYRRGAAGQAFFLAESVFSGAGRRSNSHGHDDVAIARGLVGEGAELAGGLLVFQLEADGAFGGGTEKI